MTLLALGLDTRPGPAFFAALPDRIDQAAHFVTLEDGFADATDGLDAGLLANWLAPRTRHIGLLAGAPLNFLEPFHVSTTIATLDHVTEGRGGLFAQPLRGEHADRARRAIGLLNGYPDLDPAALTRDQAEAIDVIRALWDSWEDDAIIRDKASQRFVDGAKLHYIRFRGTGFSVLGPSITPRPPQGQPVIASRLQPGDDPALAAGADLVFLAAPDEPGLRRLGAALHDTGHRPLLFADLGFGDADRPVLRWTGDDPSAWADRLGVAGLRFLPASPERDLGALLAALPPVAPHQGTLRDRLGLPPAPNRYVITASAA